MRSGLEFFAERASWKEKCQWKLQVPICVQWAAVAARKRAVRDVSQIAEKFSTTSHCLVYRVTINQPLRWDFLGQVITAWSGSGLARDAIMARGRKKKYVRFFHLSHMRWKWKWDESCEREGNLFCTLPLDSRRQVSKFSKNGGKKGERVTCIFWDRGARDRKMKHGKILSVCVLLSRIRGDFKISFLLKLARKERLSSLVTVKQCKDTRQIITDIVHRSFSPIRSEQIRKCWNSSRPSNFFSPPLYLNIRKSRLKSGRPVSYSLCLPRSDSDLVETLRKKVAHGIRAWNTPQLHDDLTFASRVPKLKQMSQEVCQLAIYSGPVHSFPPPWTQHGTCKMADSMSSHAAQLTQRCPGSLQIVSCSLSMLVPRFLVCKPRPCGQRYIWSRCRLFSLLYI